MELILTGSKVGSRSELERWIGTHRQRLIRIARSILHDHDDAEDIVQQTLAGAWQVAQTGAIRSPGAYLSRAVRWNAIKQRARHQREVLMDSLPESATAGESDDRLEPMELEMAIAQLSPTQQTAIRLRFYLGLSFREIGENLSISSNTAASRTRYALENMRRVLGLPHRQIDKESNHE